MILQLKLPTNNLSCQNLEMNNLLHRFSNRKSFAGIILENLFTFLRSCTFRQQQKSVYKNPYFAICSKRSASECLKFSHICSRPCTVGLNGSSAHFVTTGTEAPFYDGRVTHNVHYMSLTKNDRLAFNPFISEYYLFRRKVIKYCK